jgi:hypothetical protein
MNPNFNRLDTVNTLYHWFEEGGFKKESEKYRKERDKILEELKA